MSSVLGATAQAEGSAGPEAGRWGLGRCDIAPEIISRLAEGRREFCKWEREERTLSAKGAAQARRDDGEEPDYGVHGARGGN